MKSEVENYLDLNGLGALLITGNWGSGKTYFLNNELKDFITAEGYNPIVISVFGMQSLPDLSKSIYTEYCKTIDWKDQATKEKIKLWGGRLGLGVKKIFESSDWLKEKVNFSELFNLSNNLHSLIDKKTIICIDDFERLSKQINKDDFLGVINDLVDTYKLKVIIIANEEKIDPKELSYKEKVIVKTIRYSANILQVFGSLINTYENQRFKEFMHDNLPVQNSLIAEYGETDGLNIEELKDSLSNIRTIKFAIEHFYNIFCGLVEGVELTDKWSQQLNNIWFFILGTSIEFRNGNISYKYRDHLDDYMDLFDFSNLKLDLHSRSEPREEAEDPYVFARNFINKYLKRLNEEYTFYDEIYDYLTSGSSIGYNSMRDKFIKSQVEQTTIPSVSLWKKFKSGIWQMSNSEFETSLKQLLEFTSKGEIIGLSEYVQVGVFLIPFCDVLKKDKEEIKRIIRLGIDKYLVKMGDSNHLESANLRMIKYHYTDADLKEIITYIEAQLDIKQQLIYKKDSRELEKLYIHDTETFARKFFPRDMTAPDYVNIPILHNFSEIHIQAKVKRLEPKDVMALSSLFEERFIKHDFQRSLYPEVAFLILTKKHLMELDLSKPSLSNHYIKSSLLPTIDKSIICLERVGGENPTPPIH